MDMEVDIPNPEELEWLESNALFDEPDEEAFHEAEVADCFLEDPRIEQPRNALTSISANNEDEASRKRPWSGDEGPNSQRRNRKEQESVAEADEDWLRYSPPPMSPDADPGSGLAVNASRKKQKAVAEADEEWLHYSPPPKSLDADPVAGPGVVEETVISRFASDIDGECISVTAINGDRVYAKMSRWEERNDGQGKLSIQVPPTGLLAEPINVLMEKLEHEAFAKALEASSRSTSDGVQQPAVTTVSEQLWVDKYAPNSFTELLSDEQTNREVLLWLKQWDSHVFGAQVRATADDVLSALRRHSSVPSNHKLSDGRNFSRQKFSNGRNFFSENKGASWSNQIGKQFTSFPEKDATVKSVPEWWNRKSVGNSPPDQKILLLCGPPGLGKTTLAHVAAKHCGYRVVEINASDHRSSSTIESKIHDAVQMHSVMADSKPKCLIIDEIDGALTEGKGAVEVILKMVAAEKKPTGKENISQDVKPGKQPSRKNVPRAILSRPVICICNDLFAPALRPLRQVARVYTFVQPTVNRVVSRLNYICNKEGFRTNSIALTTLAEYTECDIRSCLNTLQFLNKKKESLNAMRVSSQVVGRKDMAKSVFDLWKEIFQKRKLKQERFISDRSSSTKDFDFLYSLVSNQGDYELTMDGVHENFLKLHYHDPMMQKTVKCLNTVATSDILLQYSMKTKHMSLYVYQPPMAIAVRSLISQVEKPNIEWPKSFQRYRAMFVEKKELLKIWHCKISPNLSRHLRIKSFVQDVISPLLKILSCPTLRPVALHLLSEREREDMDELVDTMLSYDITYKNLKPEIRPGIHKSETESDAVELSLDPPLHDFVNFKGYISGHLGLSSAMKQVLMHEVEKQKIIRESMGRNKGPLSGNNDAIKSQFTGQNVSISVETSHTMPIGRNDRQTLNDERKSSSIPTSTIGLKTTAPAAGLNAKASENVKKHSRGSSFFDRFRKLSNQSLMNPVDAVQKPATSERDSRPFLFKFNEGFTNAVKRPVRICDLLS